MNKDKIYESAAEYGALHNEDCCVNQEDAGACDVGTPVLGCCENMKMVESIINDTLRAAFEFVSHDLNPRDEGQRKAIVAAYMDEDMDV